jgi:drug/metabolite transporter (DMT)-like permease
MAWKYGIIVGDAILVSISLLLIRYGGKSLDISLGIRHVLSHGGWWLAGMALSWICGLVFSLLLTKFNVTYAVSLYIPLTYTITFWGGVIFLKEPVNRYKIIANIFIILGLYFFFKLGDG